MSKLYHVYFVVSQYSEQNNQTLSILTFVPVIEDDGKYLTCRAENPSIPDSALEDKWRLNVHCKFKVIFKSPQNHRHIKL